MAVNFLLGLAGFAALLWLLVTGRPVHGRHLGVLGMLWLTLVGFFVLHTRWS